MPGHRRQDSHQPVRLLSNKFVIANPLTIHRIRTSRAAPPNCEHLRHINYKVTLPHMSALMLSDQTPRGPVGCTVYRTSTGCRTVPRPPGAQAYSASHTFEYDFILEGSKSIGDLREVSTTTTVQIVTCADHARGGRRPVRICCRQKVLL